MIKNASMFPFQKNFYLMTCSAEDLIILKAFADRLKDWMDIESITSRQRASLNKQYIFNHLSPLCELSERSETLKKLDDLMNSIIRQS